MKRLLKRLFVLGLIGSLFFTVFLAIDNWAAGYHSVAPPQTVTAKIPTPPTVKAEAAVAINKATGQIIYHKQENRPMYPASLTKLMTALLVAENADWSAEVVVGREVNFAGYNSSVAGLYAGDRITIEELVWATLLPSGNDAAYVLANHVGQLVGGQQTPEAAVRTFSKLMNDRARELGAKYTSFVNPDGYHDPNHVSTAFDLALIARAAARNPKLAPILGAAQHKAQIKRGSHTIGLTWRNTNLLLDETHPNYYQWADGLKTGSTPQAGGCLAVSASKGRQDVLLVILQSTYDERFLDATMLAEYAFSIAGW